MANLPESSTWESAVTQIDTGEVISGGVSGVANRALIQLANRTKYLYDNAGSGGGSGLPQLVPDDFSLDDIDTDVSRGSAFSMIQSLDFGASNDGSVWYTFRFPSSLDDSSPINIDLTYNLNGSDDSKSVSIKTRYWCVGDGETPSSASPAGTNTDLISTGIGQDGKRQTTALTAIPAAAITADDTIILKITREGSSDTYSGTFQLLNVFLNQ